MTSSTAPQRPNFVANSAQTSLVEGLQPALRSTLSSLNINLDYELARYRYAKRGEAPPGAPSTQFRPRRQPSPDLMNVPAAKSSTRTGVMPPPPPPNPRLQQIESPPGMTTASASEVAALRSAIVRQPQSAQGSYMPSSEALLENFDQAAPYPGQGPTVRTARRRQKTWLTPLGLGALLLLLVSTAGLGFLLVNPTAASNLFQQTPLARFFPGDGVDAETAAEGELDVATGAPEVAGEPPLTPLSPDLSQREFDELELNNLSTVPSGATSLAEDLVEQQPTDEALLTPAERERAAAIRQETVNSPQQVNQIPTTTTPAPQPAAPVYQAPAPAPAPATQPAPPIQTQPQAQPAPPTTTAAAGESAAVSPSSQSTYYVVTDYTGDPSLDDARTVVQDAYVRNFDVGARIQLGAFNTSEGATALTEELRNQGVEAEVYTP